MRIKFGILSAILCFVMVLCQLLSCGVTSRYRLDLYVASEDIQKKVNVEQTQFVKDAVLGDPFQDQKYVGGIGNVAVVTVGTRWTAQESDGFRLLGFDEYWRCRLFIELPQPLESGDVTLKDKSLLQLMGHYDLSAEDKIFLSSEGSCAVDSVNSKNVFFTINGRYINSSNEPLEFSGQFKVKKSD